jgi:putative ABC transport system permease protein
MKIAGLFKLSSRSYRARPLRTFLTVLGMSIGMSAVLLLVSFGYGLQSELLKRITTADTIYTLTVTLPSSAKEKGVFIDEDRMEEFRVSEGVAEVSGAKTSQGFVKLEDVSGAVTLASIGAEYPRLSGLKTIAGEAFEEESDTHNYVLLSVPVAKTFNREPEELVGLEVDIRPIVDETTLDVSETLEQTFVIGGILEATDNVAYIHTSKSDFFIDEETPYTEARVRAESEETLEQVRKMLVGYGYNVSVIADIVRQVDTFFTIVQFILGFFGVIALIVSAVGMFNTMTVALLERTKEIGIMKSIGATNRYIALLFIIEAFTMGIMGGLLGIAIAFAEAGFINLLVNFAASRFGGESVDLFQSPLWFIGLILGFSGVVGILTGFIPAQKASKLDPLRALQYK